MREYHFYAIQRTDGSFYTNTGTWQETPINARLEPEKPDAEFIIKLYKLTDCSAIKITIAPEGCLK